MIETYTKTIDDPNAPARLRGQILTAQIERGKSMTFSVEIPDEPTAQEKGYIDWFVGEFVDNLRVEVPGLIGEKHPLHVKPLETK